MRKPFSRSLVCGLLSVGVVAGAQAKGPHFFHQAFSSKSHWGAHHGGQFQRIATLPNYLNNADIADETVSEIVAATRDGNTLVYTDGEREAIGFVDITNPAEPQPAGTLDVGGEPTSVSVLGNEYALVGVNTSASFTDPSGELLVVDLVERTVVASLALGGQPDAVAISPDGQYAAVAIENERDEEVCVGGSANGAPVPEDGPEEPGDITANACENGGGAVGVLPQTGLGNPAGFLAIVDITGSDPATWQVRSADLTGLSGYAPEDPEPEFVDINAENRAVVSLQENNHIAVVDLASAAVVEHFDLGAVTLNGVDAVEDDVISLTDTLVDVVREPDAITWIPDHMGGYRIATANEGDLFGGSRGFSIFAEDGALLYDAGTAFEEVAVKHGHYPEGRSENKGSEPESVEYARFGYADYLFVGSERGSFIAVYKLVHGQPRFVQALAGPLGPEGVLAIPERNLLVVSGEEDDPRYGVRSSIMIYQKQWGKADYPQLVSANNAMGSPIPWSALSGMVALNNREVLAVWDSFYAESNIFRIDVSRKPAVITDVTTIVGGSGDYDPEGITTAPDGTLWVASEGHNPGKRTNRLLQIDTQGNVLQEVGLPAEIENCRATGEGALKSGFEGVALLPQKGGAYKLLAAQQRPWHYTAPQCDALDDEPGYTRIWIYNPADGSWEHIAYELEPIPATASWVGLSEITLAPNGDYILVERDNRTGDFTGLKTLVKVSRSAAADGVISRDEKAVFDLVPAMQASRGWISDKPEGVAITRNGQLYLVSDNDGVDDWSGETSFLRLGHFWKLFR